MNGSKKPSRSTPLEFGKDLPIHERNVVDSALAILGKYLSKPGVSLKDPDAVRKFLQLHLGMRQTEAFAVLYLDNQHRVIAFEKPFSGTLTHTSVYPREIARAAMTHNAAAVILAHNHPSGASRPSASDQAITRTLQSALDLVEVRVLDHFIVAGREVASMAEMGLL